MSRLRPLSILNPPTTVPVGIQRHPRPVEREVHATRATVCLAHGLFGFDTLGPPPFQVHYWRGIREALIDLGCHVLVARVPAAASIRDRAHHLHYFLRRALSPNADLVILAHSMGGLDARYLVSRIRPQSLIERSKGMEGYRVRAIVSVCTPHRGSPFMDWCRDNIGLGADGNGQRAADIASEIRDSSTTSNIAHLQNTEQVLPGDLTRISPYLTSTLHRLSSLVPLLRTLDQPAYKNLTTTYLKDRFNPNTPNFANVIYHSYAARARRMSPLHPLRVPWEIVAEKEGENDGLVSVESAKWGKFMGLYEADHWEMNKGVTLPVQLGGRLGEPLDVTAMYVEAVSQLYNLGC